MSVKGVADNGTEPKLGSVLVRLAVLSILRARARVCLRAMSGLPKPRAELTCWAKGRLSPAGLAYNALGECIQLGRSQSVL